MSVECLPGLSPEHLRAVTSPASAKAEDPVRSWTLLVIECQSRISWQKIFQDHPELPSGAQLEVVQASYLDVRSISPQIHPLEMILKPVEGSRLLRKVRPDLVLVRSVAQQAGGLDSTRILYGLAASGVPCLNSITALHAEQNRQMLNGALRTLQTRLGSDLFPMVRQWYYCDHTAMSAPLFDGANWPGVPCVVKIGEGHAGSGKMLVHTEQQWLDLKSVVALHDDSCTAEQYINWDFEIRLQYIGGHVRALKRTRLDKRIWKGNIARKGEVSLEEVSFEQLDDERFEMWLSECSQLFGGLDIFSLDVIHDADTGGYYILELNGTATGLMHEREPEDHAMMRDMCIERLSQMELNDS